MGVTHKSTISQHKLTNLVMRAHTHTHIYDTSTQKYSDTQHRQLW